MWAYFNVKKRLEHKLDLTYATPTYTPPQRFSEIETTEHSIRMDGKSPLNLIELYGRTWCMDGHDYQFDRFDRMGSAIFVRSE